MALIAKDLVGPELDDKARALLSDHDCEPLTDYLDVSTAAAAMRPYLERIFVSHSVAVDAGLIKKLANGVIVFAANGLRFDGSAQIELAPSSASRGILQRREEMEALRTTIGKQQDELGGLQATIDTLHQREIELRKQLESVGAVSFDPKFRCSSGSWRSAETPTSRYAQKEHS